MTDAPNWFGPDSLKDLVKPIADLKTGTAVGDHSSIVKGLEAYGQQNAVLLGEDGVMVVARAHIVIAARELGWTHVACRRASVERSIDDSAQTSLLDVAEASGDTESLKALSRHEEAMSVDDINSLTAQAGREWVALAEFVQVEDSYKVAISCETDEIRSALLDALGVKTMYVRKRGPVSVRWPDYGRESPAALRFESEDRPDGGKSREKGT